MMASLALARSSILRRILSRNNFSQPVYKYDILRKPQNSYQILRPLSSSLEDSRSAKSRVVISFNEELKSHRDIEESLKFANSQKYIGKEEAAKIVDHLAVLVNEAKTSSLTEEDVHQMLSDERFVKIGDVLDQHVDKLLTASLLTSVDALLGMTRDDVYLIQSLETQVLWLLKTMTLPQLVKVVQIHQNHQETELRQKVLEESLSWIEKRWVEISRPKDIIYLMYLYTEGVGAGAGEREGEGHGAGERQQKFLQKLEERALDVCETMSDKDMYRMITLLSKRSSRNTPLLRKLAYHLSRCELTLSVTHVQNLLYSCVNLSLYSQRLLDNISLTILTHSPQINTQQAAGLLKSFGLLRWDKTEVLDVLTNLVLRDLSEVKIEELVNVVQACAALDYIPEGARERVMERVERVMEGVERVMERVERVSERVEVEGERESRLWLDVVWGCTVLNISSTTMISSVLHTDFITTLTGSGGTLPHLAVLKLKQIETSARHEHTDYRGPGLPDMTPHLKPPVRRKRPLVESVSQVLCNIAPSGRYLRHDVLTDAGLNVDIELGVDADLQPLPLDKSDQARHRLAFKVLDFADLTLNRQRPVGHQSLARRLLPLLGYTVIQVPYTEFNKHKTEILQLKYLKDLIKSSTSS